MTDLPTHAEYKAIAQAMNPACNAFIDGKFQAARSRKTFASVNPATGKVIAKIAACDAKDVNFTVKKAREAFDDGCWRKLHPGARKEMLIRLAKLMKRNSHELAVLKDAEDLAASLFSANAKQALRAARDIRAGTVTVNCYGEGDITTPFGGYKQSGFGERDNSLHAHDQYTELKTIWIDLSDRNAGEAVA